MGFTVEDRYLPLPTSTTYLALSQEEKPLTAAKCTT